MPPEISKNGSAVPVSGRIEMDQRQDHLSAAEPSLQDPGLVAQPRWVQKNPIALLQLGPADGLSIRYIDIRAESPCLRLFIPRQDLDIRILEPELGRPPEAEHGGIDLLPHRVPGTGEADRAAEAGDSFS